MKVVNIAVSFLTETSLSASFLLNIDSFDFEESFSGSNADPIDAFALTASCFVILPFLPVPTISFELIPFSSRIFFAAGEEEPDA